MKKMTVLLALVLCLLLAATAMAETKVNPVETTVPAVSNNGGTDYAVKISALTEAILGAFQSSRPEDITGSLKEFAEKKLGTDDFKYMLVDARGLQNGDRINVPQVDGIRYLTADFASSFFGGDKIKQIVAGFYNYGNYFVQGYDCDLAADGMSVNVKFDHLTPVIFAWIPDNTPVAAPLQAPDMPSTGDSSSLPGLFILLGMSIAAMGAMKLRRREN